MREYRRPVPLIAPQAALLLCLLGWSEERMDLSDALAAAFICAGLFAWLAPLCFGRKRQTRRPPVPIRSRSGDEPTATA
jgi:hypothetical protein